jgi:drug/metabolite transporter (DMT)-like permease
MRIPHWPAGPCTLPGQETPWTVQARPGGPRSPARKALAAGLLLLTTFIWGVTFPVVKEAVAQVSVPVFLAQRFLLATLLLVPIALAHRRGVDGCAVRRGGLMGLVLFSVYAVQTVALRHTSASNTAFLTGLNVVAVPLIGAFFYGQRITTGVKVAVPLAVAGQVLISGAGGWPGNVGDLLAAICALGVAAHLILTGRYARGSDVAWLTAGQIAVCAACSLAWALGAGEEVFRWRPVLLWPLAFCVLLGTVFAFLVQTSMQRHLSPSRIALILCLEPVFAALWAAATLGERMGVPGYTGAALILAAMVVAESTGRGQPLP